MTPLRPGVCGDVANIHDFDGPSKPSDVTTQRVTGLSIRLPIKKNKTICLPGFDTLLSDTSSVHLNTAAFPVCLEALAALFVLGCLRTFEVVYN